MTDTPQPTPAANTPGAWLSTGSKTVMAATLHMSDVEHTWLAKRARRNKTTPSDIVRTLLIKSILMEQAAGTTLVTEHKGGWNVTCLPHKPAAVVPVESSFEQA